MSHLLEPGTTETELRAIDHPMQPGWLDAGLDILNIPESDLIPDSFLRFGEDVRTIMHAVAVASRRTDGARATYEQENVAKLLLTPEEYRAYLELAGDPEKTLEYIEWFGKKATDAYAHLGHLPNFAQEAPRIGRDIKLGKIGLELGGRRQAGDWNSTKRLDTMIREVPQALHEHAGAIIDVFDNPDDPNILSYEFIPLYNIDGEGSRTFDYGTIRRCRRLADVAMGDSLLVELYKKSTFLLVLNNLSKSERRQVTGPRGRQLIDDDERNHYQEGVAGAIVEEAIQNRDATTSVVPLSAQHIMQVRAPQDVLSQLRAED